MRGHRQVDQLRLAAVAVGRDHEPPRDRVGDRAAVVAAHDVQAQVDPRGAARRRQHAAGVDVEHVRVDADLGMAAGERLGVAPVRRRLSAVEQARGGEEEDPAADRHEPRAARVRRADGVDHLASTARRASRARSTVSAVLERLEPVLDDEPEAARGGRERTGPLGGDRQLVPPRHVELRPGEAEDLDDDPELERRDPGRERERRRDACGQILTHIVIQATGRSVRRSSRLPSMTTAELAHEHFTRRLAVETDADDVATALREGTADFVLIDARSERAYAAAHLPGRDQPPAPHDHPRDARRAPGRPDRRLLLGPGLQRRDEGRRQDQRARPRGQGDARRLRVLRPRGPSGRGRAGRASPSATRPASSASWSETMVGCRRPTEPCAPCATPTAPGT